jgi:hypothetical protein
MDAANQPEIRLLADAFRCSRMIEKKFIFSSHSAIRGPEHPRNIAYLL